MQYTKKVGERESLLMELPPHLHNELKAVPDRLSKDAVMNHILRICSGGRTFTNKEISIILSRTEDWIHTYIHEMVLNHSLEIVIQEEAGSQKKKYRTVREKNQSNLGQF